MSGAHSRNKEAGELAQLAIDPGTVTGWAVWSKRFGVLSGTWNFKPRRGDGAGVRFLRLRNKLDEICASSVVKADKGLVGLQRVVYELPGHFKSVAAAALMQGMVSHIQAWCELKQIPYEGVPPTVLKKLATGKGNASKDMMLEAAREHWSDFVIEDHNEADALWLMKWAQDEMPDY